MSAVAKYIEELLRRGQHHFSTEEAVEALDGSRGAIVRALSSLKAKGELATPQRGFYVAVPPE